MAEMKGITQAIINIKGNMDKSVQKSVDKATKSMKGLKVACVASATAIAGAMVGATKYLLDVGKELDGAYDTIRIGTGATGKQLEGLKGDFEKVFASMPTTSENASQAIADFNTRLGLSGKSLQQVSKQALYLSENLGAGELTAVIEKSSRALQAWGVSEDEMSNKMDYLFKVSQSTGIGYTELAEKTQKYGATFQALGYDFESASTMIGQFVKNGVDVDSTLAGMRTSLGKLTAKGMSASEGFEEYYYKIKNATSETEAMSLASEIFGTKNGALMAKAIRDGKIEVGALTAELSKSTETIEGASFDTMDYAEKMQILKNKMKVSLAPLANTVFDSVNALMPLAEKGMEALTGIIKKLGKSLPDVIPKISSGVSKIMEVVTALMPTVEGLIGGAMEWIKQLLPTIKGLFGTISNIIKKILPIVTRLVSKVLSVVGKIMPHITKVINAILPAIQSVLDAVLPIVEKVLDTILPVIENVLDKITPIITELLDVLVPVIQEVAEWVSKIFTEIMDIAMPIIEGVVNFFSTKFSFIIDNIRSVINIIKAIFNGDFSGALDLFKGMVFNGISYIKTQFDNIVNIVDNVIAKVTEKFPAIGNVLQGVRDSLQPIIDSIKGIFGGLTDFVTNVFSGNWKGAWESVKSIFSNIFDGLAGIIKIPLNAVIGIVNKVISSINGVGFTIPDWVPIVGGKAFSLNIPEIPTFAQGGIATTPSICGEGGYPEYVLSTDPKYRQRNIGLLSRASEALNAKAERVSTGGNIIKVEFAPVINCASGDGVDIMQVLKSRMPEFVDMITRAIEAEKEGAY
jgi:phage-related minor tail protein